MTDNVNPDVMQERSRLIDHFKRAYQIIVGLAITLACTKLFPDGDFALPDTAFWLFCTFFITIVPIFHGGDRSLDIKYLGRRPSGFWARFAYVWDVYMLLITAIFFVKIAQAIPGAGLGFGGGAPPNTPQFFYEWMAYMLAFDTGVLVIDRLKSRLMKFQNSEALAAYPVWIVANLVFCSICYVAALDPPILSYDGRNNQYYCFWVRVSANAHRLLRRQEFSVSLK